MILTGKVLNAGKHILTNALVGLATSYAAGFDVGDAYGFVLDPADTAVRGNIVYQGSTHDIAVLRVAEDTVRFTCSITEGLGPFQVGNLILFMQDENSNAVPFVEVVLPFPVIKQPSADQVTTSGVVLPGTRFAISITVKLTDQADNVVVEILPPDYSSLPSFGSELDVPPAAAMTFKQYVINYDSRVKTPVLYTIDENNVRWGIPFYQQMRDPRFGQLDGGMDGEGYGGEADELVFGMWYTTPAASYTVNPVGGAKYTDGDQLNTIGGATYTKTVNSHYDNL